MSYTFDAASGASRAELSEFVLANSFSASRYTEFVKTWLNDAVTDVCRRLRMFEGFDVLDYDASGLVVQPTNPYFHVRELWLARPGSTGSGEQAVANAAQWRLTALQREMPAGVTGAQPLYYSIRRQASTDRLPRPSIVVVPARAAGKVAITGLQRPAVMDSDDDVSGLGAELDDALIAYARAKCFRLEDDFEMRDRWMVEYDTALRGAAHGGEQSDEPQTAEGAWPEDC